MRTESEILYAFKEAKVGKVLEVDSYTNDQFRVLTLEVES